MAGSQVTKRVAKTGEFEYFLLCLPFFVLPFFKTNYCLKIQRSESASPPNFLGKKKNLTGRYSMRPLPN